MFLGVPPLLAERLLSYTTIKAELYRARDFHYYHYYYFFSIY